MVIKRTSHWKRELLPERATVPPLDLRSLAFTVKSLMREKCMRMLACKSLCGPSGALLAWLCLNAHKRCLGGEPAGQELGTRLKELR